MGKQAGAIIQTGYKAACPMNLVITCLGTCWNRLERDGSSVFHLSHSIAGKIAREPPDPANLFAHTCALERFSAREGNPSSGPWFQSGFFFLATNKFPFRQGRDGGHSEAPWSILKEWRTRF